MQSNFPKPTTENELRSKLRFALKQRLGATRNGNSIKCFLRWKWMNKVINFAIICLFCRFILVFKVSQTLNSNSSFTSLNRQNLTIKFVVVSKLGKVSILICFSSKAHSFIHLFVDAFVHLFIHSFIHSDEVQSTTRTEFHVEQYVFIKLITHAVTIA